MAAGLLSRITLRGVLVLVMLHRAMAFWAQRSHAFGILVKGRGDVLEDLRLHGNVGEIRDATLAMLERNGQISVVVRPD